MLRQALDRLLRRAGYRIAPLPTLATSPADVAILDAALPFTMTGPERVLAVIDAVRHVVRAGVPGAVVECGVWRGGSMVAAARTLLDSGAADRDLYLFDTFDGMPEPSAVDVDYGGRPAAPVYNARRTAGGGSTWCGASLEEVQATMERTGYPAERLRLIKGRVEQTIPSHAPAQIALLRLDTDWYESTQHELTHLYPRVSAGGVLIVDDYGHWEGARRAVDNYFSNDERPPFLSRIDYSGRIGVKPYGIV